MAKQKIEAVLNSNKQVVQLIKKVKQASSAFSRHLTADGRIFCQVPLNVSNNSRDFSLDEA